MNCRRIPAVALVGLVLGVLPGPVRADEAGRLAVGQVMPRLSGDFLTREKAELPAVAAGRVALVALGFTYDSRFAVEDWSKRFREAFAEDARVTFFEVPMLGRLARLGRVFIDGGMRKGTAEAFHRNVITVYDGSVGDWKTRLGYTDAGSAAAYLILLDADGVVRWLYAGVPADEPVDAMVSTARALLAAR